MEPGSIRVTTFKDISGKYYTEKINELQGRHYDLASWDLIDLIRQNDKSVRQYSGVQSGFSGAFYYLIEVGYEEGSGKFCYFLLDRTR
jgi:hypothetical protein